MYDGWETYFMIKTKRIKAIEIGIKLTQITRVEINILHTTGIECGYKVL